MKARTLKQVNNRIQKKYPTIELIKGEGYFYIISEDDETAEKLASLYSTGIYTFALSHDSLEGWVNEVSELVKDLDIKKI